MTKLTLKLLILNIALFSVSPHIFCLDKTIKSGTNCAAAAASYVDWQYCDKTKLNLKGVNLTGAKLIGTNFYNTDLSGANLRYADLSKANLSKANLSQANLIGANMYAVNLMQAQLSKAIWIAGRTCTLDSVGKCS